MNPKSLLLFIFLIGFAYSAAAQDTTSVQVEFASGDNILHGTLITPDSARKLPVILYLGGIDEYGDVHRYRDSFIHENLVSNFSLNGYAIFYYYPRGVENSEGKWHRATIQDFADDAKAAIRFLKQHPKIDKQRIGILGHGEDGWVAQILAAEMPGIKTMASVAGPTFDATVHLINEYHNDYVCKGTDSTEAVHKAEEKALSHENWVSIFPLTKRWRHMKMKQDFEPETYIKNIDIPSLFVFGEQDGIVYPSWAINHLNEIFPDSLPSNIHVEVVPGANHYFKVNDNCYRYEEGDIEAEYSFRFKEVLRNWFFENL